METSVENKASDAGVRMETNGISNSDMLYRRKILNDVASNDNAFFKSQQRGEAELTFDEKRKIAEDLLSKNVALFLQRYYKILGTEDLLYFERYKDDYEVRFYLEEIKKRCNSKTFQAATRNRRYEALKKLREGSSYFSDSEMRHRNPHLYEQLVGQYLTDSERSAVNKVEDKYSSFSGFLMQQIENNYDENYLRMQENAEEKAAIEEGINDFSDDENDEEEDEKEYVSEEESFNILKRVKLPDDEKQMLRTEFTNYMYEHFLAGKDRDFDYSTVDDNAEYDSVQEREIDEEEKYFDGDSRETLVKQLQNILL